MGTLAFQMGTPFLQMGTPIFQMVTPIFQMGTSAFEWLQRAHIHIHTRIHRSPAKPFPQKAPKRTKPPGDDTQEARKRQNAPVISTESPSQGSP